MSRKVTRTDVNFLLDTVLLVLFVALCICSVILEFVFPPGTQAEGWMLWTRSYNDWSRLRFGVLAALTAAVLLHLMLHWSWVCGVIESRTRSKTQPKPPNDDPSRTLWGVGLLIVIVNLVGAVVAAAAVMIRGPALGS